MARKFPAIFALCGVIAGIVLADNIDFPAWVFLIVVFILFPLAIIAYYRKEAIITCMLALVCFALLAAFGYSFRYRTFPPGHVIHYVDNDVKYTVYGTIDDWPVIREHKTDIFIKVDSIEYAGRRENGQGGMLVHIGTETTRLQYGDRVYFKASLYSIRDGKNPSGFDYRRYLNLKSVFAVAYLPHHYSLQIDPVARWHFLRLIDSVRRAITDSFRETLDEHSAALAAGFLIGETRDIPLEIYNFFLDSGTLHLLAVSGSNVALVVAFFFFLLRFSPISHLKRTLFMLAIIILFSFLAYNQPSVVRASIMASLVLLGKALQRKIVLNNIIALAALLILLVNPTQLFDVGFQLSFITAGGLVFFTPKVTPFFKAVHNRWYYKFLIFPFIICIIAQLVALPMSAYYFQRMPIISFVSNLVIVPLVSIIVTGEVFLLLAVMILPLAGQFVGSFLNPVIQLTVTLLKYFGSPDLSMILNYNISILHLVLYYIFIVFVFVSIKSKTARRLSLFFILLTIGSCSVSGFFDQKDNYRFTVFSVPKGIITVGHLDRTQVILSDLPLKDYFITEKIIEPYLTGHQVRNPDVISLSSNYQTTREITYLMKQYNSVRVYIPESAKYVFADICKANGFPKDTALVITYDKTKWPEKINPGDIILSDKFLLYNFDSIVVAIIGQDADFNASFPKNLFAEKELLLIKPKIDKADLLSFLSDSAHIPELIICNRVTKEAGELMAQLKTSVENVPVIQETSQTGAVEVVISRGRIGIRD